MGLVFPISNFFIAKTSLANNWRSFSSSYLALDPILDPEGLTQPDPQNFRLNPNFDPFEANPIFDPELISKILPRLIVEMYPQLQPS